MTKRNKYAALERAVDAGDKDAVLLALAKLSDYDKDLLVKCSVSTCAASERKPCIGTGKGIVHFGRRVMRLLAGIR